MKRVLIALCLSLLWTAICLVLWAALTAAYVCGGVANAAKEAWTGWTMFVRLPWVE